jgi:hypothetical protein
MKRTRLQQNAIRFTAKDPSIAPCTSGQKPRRTLTSLPVPFVAPPAALNPLVALGFNPIEATIFLTYQLFHFPQKYLARVFAVSDAKVTKALDKGAVLGFGRVPRGQLLKRPRPIDEAKREKILEEGNKLLDRIHRVERLTGVSDDPIL